MRYVNGFLVVLFVGFAAVQLNDPDAYLWIPIYLVPALWAGYAAWRPLGLRSGGALGALAVSMVAALAAVVHYWPSEAGFWRRDVWWQSETAREGMGVMVIAIGLAVVALTAALTRPPEAD